MQPLTVPGALSSLKLIRRYLAHAAEEARLDPNTAYRLQLAADEIATNIVTHGYGDETTSGPIVVQAEIDSENLTVLLEDTGRAYDMSWTARPADLDLPLEQREPGGLGGFLVMQNIDSYHYERIGDRNRSTLLVHRNAGQREEMGPAERERQIAREIQAGFLPSELPRPQGWEIAAAFDPAHDVAGDFYDVFPLSNNRRIGLVIADVCGKGVGAALFMALVRSLMRAFARQHYSLDLLDTLTGDAPNITSSSGGNSSGVLSSAGHSRPFPRDRRGRYDAPATGAMALNKAVTLTSEYIITNHGEQDMYATLFFGALDPLTGSMLYINAGHNPPLVQGHGGVKATLNPTGPAVGIIPGAHYGIGEIRLESGETLLAYTDGVTEARSPSEDFYGDERLLELLNQPVLSAQGLLDQVEASLAGHLAGSRPNDDVTMLAVRRR